MATGTNASLLMNAVSTIILRFVRFAFSIVLIHSNSYAPLSISTLTLSDPTPHPTKNPTHKPTKYPTKYPTQEPTKDICGKTDEVGEGCCKDYRGKEYGGLIKGGFENEHDCAAACINIEPCGLVGYGLKEKGHEEDWKHDGHPDDYYCFCHYEAGKVPEAPGGWMSVDDEGYGDIDEAGECNEDPGHPEPVCYRYIVSSILRTLQPLSVVPLIAYPVISHNQQFFALGR